MRAKEWFWRGGREAPGKGSCKRVRSPDEKAPSLLTSTPAPGGVIGQVKLFSGAHDAVIRVFDVIRRRSERDILP